MEAPDGESLRRSRLVHALEVTLFGSWRAAVHLGWAVAVGAAVVNLASSVLSPNVFAFFVAPIGGEMGWSRAEISAALSFRLAAAAAVGPALSISVERFGPRWTGGAVAALGTAGLLFAARSTTLPELYGAYALTGLAGFGGGSTIVTTVPIALWFMQGRGRVLTLIAAALPLGSVISIQLTQRLLERADWRETWSVLAVCFGVLVFAASTLLLRGSPERYGRRPFGAGRRSAEESVDDSSEDVWSRRAAARSPTTWLLVTALALMSFVAGGTLVHRVGYWLGSGLPLDVVALATSADPFTVMCSALLFSFVADRLPIRFLSAIGPVGWAGAMLALAVGHGSPAFMFVHSVIWGAAAGAYLSAVSLVWIAYYGRLSLVRVQAIAWPFTMVASGLGPPAYGALLDRIDATAVWLFSIVCLAISAAIFILVRRPSLHCD